MDNKELVTVYTLGDSFRAELIKNALGEEGIRCFLEGIGQATEVQLVANEIKVQVAAKDAELARQIIEEHERRGETSPEPAEELE